MRGPRQLRSPFAAGEIGERTDGEGAGGDAPEEEIAGNQMAPGRALQDRHITIGVASVGYGGAGMPSTIDEPSTLYDLQLLEGHYSRLSLRAGRIEDESRFLPAKRDSSRYAEINGYRGAPEVAVQHAGAGTARGRW